MEVSDLRIALFSGNYNMTVDGANKALNRLVGYLLAQGAAVRFGAGGNVAHQFRVQRPGLAATGVQAAVRVQVRAGHHQLLLQGDSAHQVQKKRFASTVLANDQAECGAAVGNPVDVADERLDFPRAAYLNQVLPRAWHNPGAKRLNDSVPVSGADDWGSSGGVHVS